jgi:hypothetical protein
MALYFDLFQRPRRSPTLEEVEEEKKFLPPPEEVEEEEQFLPPSEEVETVSSPSFSVWSSSDDDSERNFEDDEDTTTEMPEDSLHLECLEKAERKAEEEDEMLKKKEMLLESFATARK